MEHILNLAKKFHQFSPYRGVEFNDDRMRQTIVNLLGTGVILCTSGGFLAGLLTPLIFNPDILVAAELAWWSEDGQGENLMNEFELWAIESGASVVQYSALNNPDLDKMDKRYRSAGLSMAEVSYIKAL